MTTTIKESHQVTLSDYEIRSGELSSKRYDRLSNTDIDELIYSLQEAGINIDKSKSQKIIYSDEQEIIVDLGSNDDISGLLRELILVGDGLEVKIKDFISGGGTGAIGGDVYVTEGIEFNVVYQGDNYMKASRQVKNVSAKIKEFYKTQKL